MSQEKENDKENNNPNEKIFLFTNIFHAIPNNPSKLLPLVSSPNDINILFSFLNYNNENTEENIKDENYKKTIYTKIQLLNFLMSLFKINSNLIYLFLKKCKSNIKSFFNPIIDIYLNEHTTDENKKIIEDLLELIIKNVSTQKTILEYIYQRLSVFFRNDAKITLTESLLVKFLNLLNLFYTSSFNDKSTIDNLANFNEIEKNKEIKNFIYLNGNNNKLSLILNNVSTNINTDFPTLENGFSFIFWINMEKHLIESFFLLHKDDGQTINLINVIFEGHQIKLQLLSVDYLVLIIDDEIKSNFINFSNQFNYGQWNSFYFILYPKKISSLIKTASFKLYINNSMYNIIVNYPKNFVLPLEEKINNITFFENIIGKITSILFFSYAIDDDKINILSNSIKEPGFYKIKYLYKFFLSNDKEYPQFTKSYKYYEKFKNNINKNSKFIDITSKEQNLKNLICFLCPFCYDNKKNHIEDIFGNFIGVLTSEDGVNNYINYYKNIKQLGGMNNLLPIAELMLLSQNKKNDNINDNNYINFKLLDRYALTENTFLKYLIIIKKNNNRK